MDEAKRESIIPKKLLNQWTIPAEALARVTEDKGIQCLACGHRCLLKKGNRGICGVRINAGDCLSVPWGYVAGLQVDPIEKKPFFHVLPGARALSFGMLGCNLHCAFCQNWFSSQSVRDKNALAGTRMCSPEEIAALARDSGAKLVISTYNEPLITSEWSHKIFSLAKEQGFLCGYVSNGNASQEVLEYLRPVMDIFKIDLKCFRDATYRTLGCRLETIKETIRQAVKMNYWVEVVTLLIPGMNDDGEELKALTQFLVSVSPSIPWHVTAFHPDYRMTSNRPTSSKDLLRAWEIGKEAGLHYIYAGNLPGCVDSKENTCCPQCHATLIERSGFRILKNRLTSGNCPDCEKIIPGRWAARDSF